MATFKPGKDQYGNSIPIKTAKEAAGPAPVIPVPKSRPGPGAGTGRIPGEKAPSLKIITEDAWKGS